MLIHPKCSECGGESDVVEFTPPIPDDVDGFVCARCTRAGFFRVRRWFSFYDTPTDSDYFPHVDEFDALIDATRLMDVDYGNPEWCRVGVVHFDSPSFDVDPSWSLFDHLWGNPRVQYLRVDGWDPDSTKWSDFVGCLVALIRDDVDSGTVPDGSTFDDVVDIVDANTYLLDAMRSCGIPIRFDDDTMRLVNESIDEVNRRLSS